MGRAISIFRYGCVELDARALRTGIETHPVSDGLEARLAEITGKPGRSRIRWSHAERPNFAFIAHTSRPPPTRHECALFVLRCSLVVFLAPAVDAWLILGPLIIFLALHAGKISHNLKMKNIKSCSVIGCRRSWEPWDLYPVKSKEVSSEKKNASFSLSHYDWLRRLAAPRSFRMMV